MNHILRHRGPDGEGVWEHPSGHIGLAHRRLSIIDIEHGHQPMSDARSNQITYNGEVYNFLEIREQLGGRLRTHSDTEVVLEAWTKWGESCVERFRGMFSFAVWDEVNQTLFCARDRFGIKPFYYTVVDGRFVFASEIKALLPFVSDIDTDIESFRDYLSFQFCLGGKTLFRGIKELLPGHLLVVRDGLLTTRRYWEVHYDLDFDNTATHFQHRVRELFDDSIRLHLRSDVPVGAYLSGGLDSSIVASHGAGQYSEPLVTFHGRFEEAPEYDESHYARLLADQAGCVLKTTKIGVNDFLEHIRDVVYHLDMPVAGPGSFPQFMVSRLASQHRKVVLGGQGGDEIFGGYARYLIAYFEQCIKGAIDGTMNSGNFVVTYESIIPNLTTLQQYKPLLKHFWHDGLFDDLSARYFRLIDRSGDIGKEINWEAVGDYSPMDSFLSIFHADNVGKESYFDSMTHFDFKTLLPALLHVEDRMSMAHSLEARVPFLDHPLVEYVATAPADVKFENGSLKHLLRTSLGRDLPTQITKRKDKMGFPVPLTEWLQVGARDFLRDVLGSQRALERDLIRNDVVLDSLDKEPQFGRKIWGLLSLELWQQAFHDRHHEFRQLWKTRQTN